MSIDPGLPQRGLVPRAIVVDDDPGTLDTASLALRAAGFDVTVAASGAAALQGLRDTEFDLVVLADTAGVDVLDQIRGNHDVPVIMVGRGRDQRAARSMLAVGRLRIDLPRHEVAVGELPVAVTASEFRVLALLAGSPGTVFSRRQIMEHVWGGAYFGDGHPVDTHVLNLRRKIEADPTRPRRLLTVRGVGFKLVAPPGESVGDPDETLIRR